MVDPVVYIIMLHSPMLQIFLDLFCFSTDKIDRDQRALTADVTVVIRDDIGSRAVLTPFRGLMSGTTSIIVKQDFLFHKFTLAHAIGHMIGCGHEKTTSNMFHTTGWKSKKVRPKEWPQFLSVAIFLMISLQLSFIDSFSSFSVKNIFFKVNTFQSGGQKV